MSEYIFIYFIFHLSRDLISILAVGLFKFWRQICSSTPSFRRFEISNEFWNIFLKNGSTPASFSFIFDLFKQTILFSQQINVKNAHPVYGAEIQTPWPLEHESSPITTRPGLPPNFEIVLFFKWAILGLFLCLFSSFQHYWQ